MSKLPDQEINPPIPAECRGQSAIILLREEITDLRNRVGFRHFRLKIPTADGRDEANVAIPFAKGVFRVSEIEARTIQADGRVVPFSGAIFETKGLKMRGIDVRVKTFTLPEAQVGSVLEYRYKIDYDRLVVPEWTVTHELFTLKAYFRVASPERVGLNYIAKVPDSSPIVRVGVGDGLEATFHNVPAYVEEPLALPRALAERRVVFTYQWPTVGAAFSPRDMAATPEDFWAAVSEEMGEYVDPMIEKRKTVAAAVANLVNPSESPERNLRRLYDKVQTIRLAESDPLASKKEAKANAPRENKSADDVLRNGYGDEGDINILMVAMARAAGWTAHLVGIAERDRNLFAPKFRSESQLAGYVTRVTLPDHCCPN